MEKRKSLLWGSVLIIAFILGACADLPKEEMEAADAAVSQAEHDPDAAFYGEPALKKAKTALEKMQEEASAKRYEAAKNRAQEAIKAAAQAREDGRAGATRAQGDAGRVLADVKDFSAETQASLENAKSLGNLEADFESLEDRLGNAQALITAAENDFSNGSYQEVQEKCRSARLILNGVNGELSTAVQIISRKK